MGEAPILLKVHRRAAVIGDLSQELREICRLLPGLQAKLSYEKAYRLPTTEELFGDEDLETGSTMIRPENSHNLNLNLSYRLKAGRHSLYAEGGLIYRDTRDYIQRAIAELSGNREGAFYENYGRVKTTGGNVSVRYSFGPWLSVGGSRPSPSRAARPS